MHISPKNKLVIANVTKEYRLGDVTLTAVDHLSLHLPPENTIAITGPSGCGKTTLLNMIAGIILPTSGNIYFDDEDISHYDDDQRTLFRRRKIGVIFQDFSLIPQLDVKGNILFPLALDGKDADANLYADIIDFLGLKGHETFFPRELSGGLQQRCAIARALITKPALILADEPTGNLDMDNTNAVIALLKSCAKKYKQTIVIVTHEAHVAQMADHRVQMLDGKITQSSFPQNHEATAREVSS